MGGQREDIIVCKQCGYKIDRLMDFRCPRCNTLLLQCCSCSGNCKKCAVPYGDENSGKKK